MSLALKHSFPDEISLISSTGVSRCWHLSSCSRRLPLRISSCLRLANLYRDRRDDPVSLSERSCSVANSPRTSIFAFLIDSAYVLFHNSPPRIALAELKMDLALPERCFQASTADECFLGIQWWLCKTQRNQPHRYSSLFDFVGMFCRDELDLLTVDICGHEAYMNYFAITCGECSYFTLPRLSNFGFPPC